MTERTGVALALSIALVCGSTWGRATETDAEARSRTLFSQAVGLAQAGKWTEACPLFRAAHELHSTGGTALQAGNCYEKIDQPERALPFYQYVVDHRATDKNTQRVAIAEERLRTLEKQVGDHGATPATAPPEPTAPPATTAPAPSATPPAPPVATSPAPAPSAGPTATPPDVAPVAAPSRVPAYVAFGVGGVGIVVGAITGALALSQASDVEASCIGSHCLASDADAASAARTKAWVSNIAFGVGIVGVATGVVLLITSHGKAKSAVGANARGLVVRF